MPKKAHRIAPEVKTDILRRILRKTGSPSPRPLPSTASTRRPSYAWLTKEAEGTPSIGAFVKLQREKAELLRLSGELTLQLSAQQKRG